MTQLKEEKLYNCFQKKSFTKKWRPKFAAGSSNFNFMFIFGNSNSNLATLEVRFTFCANVDANCPEEIFNKESCALSSSFLVYQ
jgi:hypothetical protein